MLFFILLSIILFIFGLYYYYENKKLKQKIKELEQETKTILERKIINNKEDLIPIENISIQPTMQEKNIIPNTKEKQQHDIKEENTSLEIPKYKARTNEEEVLTPKIDIPTTITLETKELDKKESTIPNISLSKEFNPNEFIKSIKEQSIKDTENSTSDAKYLETIFKQIEKELTPQTIDLTEYEKNQEEQAVISYQELLSLKEKKQNERIQNKALLQELKEFKNLLKQGN